MAREMVDERYLDANSYLFGNYELTFTIYKETSINLYEVEIVNSLSNNICTVSELYSQEEALKYIEKFANAVTENDSNVFVDLI